MAHKTFSPSGLAQLRTHLSALADTANQASSSVTSLNGDVTNLRKTQGELATSIVEALKEMNEVKQDVLEKHSVIIPNTGWSSDNTNARFTKYRDISVEDITANDRIDVNFMPDSLLTAYYAGFSTVAESFNGKFRVRAIEIPTANINIEYWITREPTEITETEPEGE